MDQDKPFKSIEVVDSRTNQVCKVACMSCIRGHRTISCGIPVCRTKVFWTVKRPGRPSNSCTCRYSATGGCKCVVARSACPHKAKKGEKRSGECRCDEQGRYCCILEPQHWDALFSLQKPTVEFHSTREALEARQTAPPPPTSLPQTPAFSIASPPSTDSIPSTSSHYTSNGYGNYQHVQSSGLTPRFGMMGIGAPQSAGQHSTPDVLAWEGQAPMAQRELNLPTAYEAARTERRSCCQQSPPSAQPVNSPPAAIDTPFHHLNSMPELSFTQNFTNLHEPVPVPAATRPTSARTYEAPAFDFNRMQAEYLAHQLPSAICQNCGLSGCTCRHCPPIFQSYGTTSWAQCCGRKHARDVQTMPLPIPAKIARTESYVGEDALAQAPSAYMQGDPYAQVPPFPLESQSHFNHYGDIGFPPASTEPDFPTFALDPGLLMPDTGQPLDISEFLLSDLNRLKQEPVADGGETPGGGGGGCCCGD